MCWLNIVDSLILHWFVASLTNCENVPSTSLRTLRVFAKLAGENQFIRLVDKLSKLCNLMEISVHPLPPSAMWKFQQFWMFSTSAVHLHQLKNSNLTKPIVWVHPFAISHPLNWKQKLALFRKFIVSNMFDRSYLENFEKLFVFVEFLFGRFCLVKLMSLGYNLDACKCND